MAKPAQQPCPVMRGATGLDGDARGREALEERDHVPAPQLPAQDGSLGGIDAVELEDVLGRVHADAANRVPRTASSREICNDLTLAQRCHTRGPSTPTLVARTGQPTPDLVGEGLAEL